MLGTAMHASTAPPTAVPPQQHVIKVRRDYNAWVASETLEDYALRFTPRSFRKWSEWRVANTAFGGAASFLVLEALGATLLLQFGFINTFWAVLATAFIVFAAGLPISVYAARHGLDMDLLTRGAGFGYIGSTITSLIYASFTFIFFALEAAIMAYALELLFDIPPAWGYLICALVVIPMVTHGVTVISRFQVWTQPLWLVLLVGPYVFVFQAHPTLAAELRAYAGESGQGGSFDPLLFGGALTVGVALITQMGEQVDYLRFMPEKTPANRVRWWAAVLVGGPGWVLPGVAKMLGGALLAYLALTLAVPADRAVDPNQMYLAAYEIVFSQYGWALGATVLLVVVSQLKINVTNAYAGSLAWSNFFARVTHSHPGRVVWVVFNTLIALMLMELEVFKAIGSVLGLYSNIAISWIMAVVADLVVNKPLGLSPKGVEFKRAHLYDINPVGVGAMGAASVLSMLAWLGAFGPMAQAFSAVIAMVVAFVCVPLLAWFTKGRYYIARHAETAEPGGAYLGARMQRRCVICERDYECEDMARCPAYGGPICSLCCSLDARCGDLCKPESARAGLQFKALLRRLTPKAWWPQLDAGLGRYLLLMACVAPALAGLLALVYQAELRQLAAQDLASAGPALRASFVKTYCALLLVGSVIGWWLVLAQSSRRVAQEESHRQTQALVQEIASHARTDEELQRAKLAAEAARNSADAANQAKTRYISAISHELRTPLNSILGYAQLLDEDPAMPPHRKQAVGVIRRGGEHLLGLIEGTLDIARIEGGKLALDAKPMRLRENLQQIVQLFELQAVGKGLRFEHHIDGAPQLVRADERRLTQVLINVLGNAVKFTQAGRVSFRAAHVRDMAVFEIEDTGPGIAPADLERIFEPFSRGAHASAAGSASSGTGLGLTIAKMLTDLMGGEMTVSSRTADPAMPQAAAAAGTLFRIRLFLPELRGAHAPQAVPPRAGYLGARRRILVVDNEEVDRTLLARRLQALGFEVLEASSGTAALGLLEEAAAGLGGASGVDAILMDLAMPGIDGWQTIRTLRAQRLSAAPVAIVSANAFDKGLDNDVGIGADDFITKPVRLEELLDWLGAQLALQWHAVPPAPLPDAVPLDAPRPSRQDLQALHEVARLGYPRGVQRLLDRIEHERPECIPWLAPLRTLAQNFQFDRMTAQIQDVLARTPSA